MTVVVSPDRDGAALDGLARAADAVLSVFARAGYRHVEPPIIEPADAFIERSGEEIRRRLYMVSDPSGQELCLRPDLTIPVCRLFLRGGAKTPARLAYCGPAFRWEPPESGRSGQFLQAGVEAIGHEDRETADAEILAACIEAVRQGGLDQIAVEIGDLGLIKGLLDRLPIPEAWRARLKRHAQRPDRLRTVLDRLRPSDREERESRRSAFLDALAQLGDEQARLVVEEVLSLAEIAQAGGRGVAEIAERFLDQAADAATGGLSGELAYLIETVLAIDGRAADAPARLRDLAAGAGVRFDPEIHTFARRLDLLEKRGLAADRLYVSAEYGGGLGYYTGFVFRVRAFDRTGPEIAGGGRYDDLLCLLGAPGDLPAVGCAIRLEDVVALAGKDAP